MITCPHCKHQEYVGSLFCSNCGAQLIYPAQKSNQTVIHTQRRGTPHQRAEVDPLYEGSPPYSHGVYLIEADAFLSLEKKEETTLGRTSPEQVLMPDIDLKPYDGFEKGVSRLHATILYNAEQHTAYVIDLGSANGTRVNGTPIPAHSEVPIHHNDILTLGKLKIQVIIAPQEIAKEK